MEVPLQYEQAAQCIGLSPSGSRSHRPDGPKTGHALTLTLDHSKEANQFLGLASIFAFSFSGSFEVAIVTLLAAGLCNACSNSNQSAFIFLSAIAAMRSSMMGALNMCIGVGQFGFLHQGILTGVCGGATAIAVMAGTGMVAMAAVFFLLPVLRKRR